MVGDERAHALGLQARQEVAEHRQPLVVEVRRRLVEQEGAGPGHEGHGDRHLLLLPAGQPGEAAPQQAGDADPLGDLAQPAPDAPALPAQVLAGEGELTGDVEGEEFRARVLEDGADGGREPGQGHLRHRAPVDLDPAGQARLVEGGHEPVDAAQDGGLAAARGPRQQHDPAVGHVQAQVLQGAHARPVVEVGHAAAVQSQAHRPIRTARPITTAVAATTRASAAPRRGSIRAVRRRSGSMPLHTATAESSSAMRAERMRTGTTRRSAWARGRVSQTRQAGPVRRRRATEPMRRISPRRVGT